MLPCRKDVYVTGGHGRLARLVDAYLDRRFYEVHILPRDAYAINCKEDSIVLHLAWSGTPFSMEPVKRCVTWKESIDCAKLEYVIDDCLTKKNKLIFFSSGGAVYGNAGAEPSKETDECNPISWYGETKLLAEKMIENSGVNHVNLRISNPYCENELGIIYKATLYALQGRLLDVYGSTNAKKDFLHYTDFISGLEEVIAKNLSGTHNLCSGKSVTIGHVYDLIEWHTMRMVQKHYVHDFDNKWDVTDCRLSNKKLVENTTWKPLVDIDIDGIPLTLASL